MNINKTILRKIGLFSVLMGFAGITQAQYIDDGLRFSQTDIGATARFKAMGGAQTALGGDLSSIAGNPAGLGFYNNSDASFTLGFQNDLNKSTYFSNSTNRNKNNFGFDQAGVLIHMPVMKPYGQNMQTGWLNFNVGVSYNKTQDFNTNIDFTGENDISSYTDMLADFSDYNPVYNAWGKESYFVRDNGEYAYPTTSEESTNNQNNKEFRSGNQYQTNIAFGANYSNKFYIGASVGVAGFHYESSRTFSELGIMKSASEFANYDHKNVDFLDPKSTAHTFLNEDYELLSSSFQVSDGSGVNATLGMIFLPHKMWRIGLSATTPTWYKVRDDFTMYMDSWMIDQADNELFSYASNEENYYDEYDLRTPYKINAGVAALFEGGLLSADVEYVDYASMRITQSNQSGADKDEQTAEIKENYQGTINLRVGGEYVFSPQLLARAGYNYQGSPYKDLESTRQTVSAGLGYRINNVYVDLAYQNQLYKHEYVPYQSTVNPTEAALIENTRNNVLLTLGVKF